MEGLIQGLVLWAYVLAGLLVVPLVTVLLTSLGKPRGHAIAIAAAIWYLGAPAVVFLLGLYGKWDAYRVNQEYLALCRTKAVESISKVSQNIDWIKLDSGAKDQAYPRSPSDAFGADYRSRLFGHANQNSRKGLGRYRNIETAHGSAPRFLIVRIRSSDVIPYVGTFYATALDIEIVDPTSMTVLAHRRTFARNPSHPSAKDCDQKNLHATNLQFLQSAIERGPAN